MVLFYKGRKTERKKPPQTTRNTLRANLNFICILRHYDLPGGDSIYEYVHQIRGGCFCLKHR